MCAKGYTFSCVCLCVCVYVCMCVHVTKKNLFTCLPVKCLCEKDAHYCRQRCLLQQLSRKESAIPIHAIFCNIMVKLHLVQKLSCSLLEMQEKPTPI